MHAVYLCTQQLIVLALTTAICSLYIRLPVPVLSSFLLYFYMFFYYCSFTCTYIWFLYVS